MKITLLTDDLIVGYSDSELAALRDAVPDADFACCRRETVSFSELVDSEVIFGWPPIQMLKELVNLKWLHLASAGANNYTDVSLYADPSVLLTKSSGTFGIPIAEHVIGMMLALSRCFLLHHGDQREGLWRHEHRESIELYGSNVFVLGLGDIGTEVCRRLSGFGCNIVGFRRDASLPHEFVSDVRPVSRLRDSLPDADYIVICLPGTTETDKLIGRSEFDLMKKRAIIVNIGRGSVIDTDALVEALNSHKISGAGIDVTDPEPLPPGHPLWIAENTLITPHVSSSSPHGADRRLAIFTDLLKRYMSGRPLYNIVKFDAGY